MGRAAKCLLPDDNKENLSNRIRFSRKSFDDTNSINVFATLKIDFTIYYFTVDSKTFKKFFEMSCLKVRKGTVHH